MDLALADVRLLEQSLEWRDEPRPEVRRALLKLGALDDHAQVAVLMQRLDANLELLVCRKHLLDALRLLAQLAHGAGRGAWVGELGVLLDEGVREHVEAYLVEVAPAQRGVPGDALDHHGAGGLVLLAGDGGEGGKRNLVRSSAHVVEDDVGCLVSLELALLVEPILKGEGGVFVHEGEHIELGDGGGIKHGCALRRLKVGRHEDDGVLDGGAGVGLGDLLGVREDEGDQLLAAEGGVLAVTDDGGLGVLVLDERVRESLLAKRLDLVG
mmetsp:Transcript_30258/g.65039  ORF Transcript_30258/g.65039 Transcript_30258/m.65039 type:complete len:269 (-) Transcript_30258:436-1242(-)